ncbi:MAG: hydrogenase 3 maturation endopeptidase HyCI [Spirochaetales bacterium]|nr:hydrogenase 3 maturation endopeptidase HyCI [Spirochaetales bacterium]
MGSRKSLQKILSRKCTIAGIGNVLKGDDGAGSILAQRLHKLCAGHCYDTGISPERYFGKIIKEKPGTVLFIDAVHMGTEPGEWRILDPLSIEKYMMNTHALSLHYMIEELKRMTGCNVYLLGIQPRTLAWGMDLSPAVRKSLHVLEKLIVKSVFDFSGCN